MTRIFHFSDELRVEISEDDITLFQDLGGEPNLVGFHPRLWMPLHAIVVDVLPDLAQQPPAQEFPLTSASPKYFNLEVEVTMDGTVVLTQHGNGKVDRIQVHPQQLRAVIDYVRRKLHEAST